MTVYHYYQPNCVKYLQRHHPEQPLPRKVHVFELTMGGLKPVGSFASVNQPQPSSSSAAPTTRKRTHTAALDAISPERKRGAMTLVTLSKREQSTEEIVKRTIQEIVSRHPELAPIKDKVTAEFIQHANDPTGAIGKVIKLVKKDSRLFEKFLAIMMKAFEASKKEVALLKG